MITEDFLLGKLMMCLLLLAPDRGVLSFYVDTLITGRVLRNIVGGWGGQRTAAFLWMAPQ